MFLRSAIAAFSMYSRIPMPGIVWNERTTRYLLCWFPAVGLAISAAQFFLLALLRWSDTGAVLKGVLLAALPLLITGGIHLDGFLDAVDARTSCAPWEKKLEILKDPHIGAFAAIYCGIYLLLSAGAWSEAGLRAMRIMVYVFPLERAMSGYLALKLPDARAGGSLAQLKDSSPRKFAFDRGGGMRRRGTVCRMETGAGRALRDGDCNHLLPAHGHAGLWRRDRRPGRMVSAGQRACGAADAGHSGENGVKKESAR